MSLKLKWKKKINLQSRKEAKTSEDSNVGKCATLFSTELWFVCCFNERQFTHKGKTKQKYGKQTWRARKEGKYPNTLVPMMLLRDQTKLSRNTLHLVTHKQTNKKYCDLYLIHERYTYKKCEIQNIKNNPKNLTSKHQFFFFGLIFGNTESKTHRTHSKKKRRKKHSYLYTGPLHHQNRYMEEPKDRREWIERLSEERKKRV